MQPSFIETYRGAFIEGFTGYLLFCGAAFVLFYVVLRRMLRHRKITQKPTDLRDPLKEIARTMVSTLLGKGTLVVVMAYLAYHHLIPAKLIYKHIEDHGWLYFGLTVIFDVLFFDLWFYLSHRFWLHSRFGYRHIHIVHHRSVDPTPFARNSVHPVEGFFNGLFHILPVFIMPHHPAAILVSTQIKGLVGVLGHLGYETFWSGFSRHWLGKYIVTPVHHHLHHSKNVRTNFSFLINYDQIFGTLSPDYHRIFEETVQRGKRAAAAELEAQPALAAAAHVRPGAPGDRQSA